MPTRDVQVRKDTRLFLELCETLLSRGHQVRFRVHGDSMRPNLLDDDQILVAPATQEDLRPGDVAFTQTADGLRVHRVNRLSAAEISTRGDSGLENDRTTLRVFGKILSRSHGDKEISFSTWQTRFVHPLRSVSHRLRVAAALRFRQFAVLLTAIFSLLVLSATIFAPDIDAQNADLQLVQTASSSAVATNATTQSLGTAATATWAGGTATFTFPTPLPSGVFTNALLTTTGFTPAAYNVSGASITSVNYGTGAVTVALASQSMGGATGATWTSGVASFTFPTPLPSEAVVGAQLTTTGFTPATYNVTNATITSITGGVVTVALAPQSLGAASNATWAGGHITFTFTNALPSNAVVNAILTTTGFTPAAYNVTNATITAVNAGAHTIQVALAANPGAETALGTGTVGPRSSTANGTGTVNPSTSTVNGTGTVPTGYTYSEVVTNNTTGTTVATGTITVYMQTPANTVYESYFGTNWSCTNPGTGNVGPIVCTYNTTLNGGATASTLTVGFQINSGTAAGTTIQGSATVTNSTDIDTVPSNNTSITSIVVEPANTSDLALSMSVAPTPVFVSSTFTYTLQVQNLGQATAPATSNVLTDTLPSGLTNVNVSAPSGWTCSGTSSVTCSSAALAMGATATITISATSPSTAQTLTNTATISLPGDPNSANNSATAYTVVQPIACATPGRDGAGGTLSGVVNTYYPPANTGTLASASTSVTLGTAQGNTGKPITAGDLVLIIQMQDASINDSNSSSYGHGVPGDPGAGYTSLSSSGLFEFVTATGFSGGVLTFTGTGPTGGLLNNYYYNVATTTQGLQTYQVIRVPQYASATLSSGLVPLAWPGGTAGTYVGGVLAIDVSSQLTLGGTVALDSLGFRGGGGITLTGVTSGAGADTDYVTDSPANLPNLSGGGDAPANSGVNASKGEGIAGTPHWVAPLLSTVVGPPAVLTSTSLSTGQSVVEGLPAGSFARGAPGNAGGGGTDGDPVGNTENSGGGAGGNGGTGGQGGYGWNSMAATNSTDGGFGGVAFPASTSALVMGGGGGAGTVNNGSYYISGTSNGADCGTSCTGVFSSGGAGGGVVMIHAGSVVGTGTITSNGESTLSTLNDSTGGGGAGGSILVFANSGGLSGLTVSAVGGSAGNAWPNEAPGGFPGQRHGPGGGGGGGVIFLTATPANSNLQASVAGGANGYTDTVQDSYGATPGASGTIATTNIITETPGTQSGGYCGTADLAVTNSGSPSVVAPGGNIVYTQVVTNNGPLAAVNAVFSEAIPANTTFVSLPNVAGWQCTTPSPGNAGNITCNNPDVPTVANGGTYTFTLTVQVSSTATSGTQIVDVANIVSGTTDPNLANNSATVVTTVGALGTADLQVINTASAATTVAGTNVTMTAAVTNLGPSSASGVIFTETVPANTTVGTTFVPPSGWSCNSFPAGTAAGSTLTCSIATLAAGGTANFPLVLNVNSGTASGTVISATANITSSTPDPNSLNNSSTATTTVATSGQSDLAVTSSASPNPVTQGNNITYTQVVTNNGPSAATSATFTDTIPAGTTLGATFNAPANWTCNPIAVGGTGTITCTLNAGQNIPVNGTVNFPLVVNVDLTTAAGTTITNTANINEPCSPTSDPNCSNNTASTSVIVASPTQADLSIVKTAAPEPVDMGTNLTYTLIVSNNGPAVAQNVTVQDDIPTTVTYVNASSTQGSCSTTTINVTTPYASTLQVNCSLGSVGVGAQIVVTINVTASTFSANSLTTNTATVSSTTSDPNSANNTSTANSTIQSPTAVGLATFNAYRQLDGSVLLEWHTSEESRNLGFHVYREDSSGRHRINPSLIVGTALLLRGSRPQHAAKTYRWVDPQPVDDAIYWIEDVDIAGARTLHGPASIQFVAFAPTDVAPKATANLLPVANQPRRGGPLGYYHPEVRLSTPLPVFPASPASVSSSVLAGRPAIKIGVDQEGWYSVTFKELYAAGLSPNTDPRTLRLYAEGVEQPLLFFTTSSGPDIEFYGTGIDTPFSGTRIYWLVAEDSVPNRILPAPQADFGPPAPSSFPFTVIRQDRITYFAALLNGENNDNFFGPIITSDPVDQDLLVAHFDASSSQPISLDVALQGVTDGQFHSTSIQFNGTTIGEVDFYGMVAASQTFSIDPSLLVEGTNTVTLTALEGDNDVSLVQYVQLHYPHTYAADADWLRATAPEGSSLQITGFSIPAIRVFDITNPLSITELSGKVSGSNGNYQIAVNLALSGTQQRTILAFASDAVYAPSSLTFHTSLFLSQQRSGADIVMISHPNFLANVAPLVRLRESQGHQVALVTTDQIFDEYNYGERSPFAVRSFLQNAAANWARKPQAILLVGDASFDPRNYLGFGDFDFVPSRMIETSAFKTASDDWLTDFQQTGYATIPTGRLPVRTTSDADLVISKIVNYEQNTSTGPWNSQAIFIADQNADTNFSSAANAASANLPSAVTPTLLLTDGMDPATAHAQIVSAINNGALLVNYDGHGAEQQWSFSDIFDTNDAQALTNGGRLPVFLMMDCLNGFFQDVYAQSLAVSVLLAPNGGGVAVWASSGFTSQPPQATMNQALLRQFMLHPNYPLGSLILAAKSGTTDNDVRRTWTLFGDPAMKFQLGSASATSAATAPAASRKTLVRSAGNARSMCKANSPCPLENPK